MRVEISFTDQIMLVPWLNLLLTQSNCNPSPLNIHRLLKYDFSRNEIFEGKTLTVTAFNILDFLEKSGLLTTATIDGKPFKIRIRFESEVDYSAKKRAIRILQDMGFQQVGNTSSWVLMPKSSFNVEAD